MILLYPISVYRIPFPQIEDLKYHYKIKNMFLGLHFANCILQISAVNHHSLIPKWVFLLATEMVHILRSYQQGKVVYARPNLSEDFETHFFDLRHVFDYHA